MAKTTIDTETILKRATPLAHQQAHEIQPFGHLVTDADRAVGERVQGKRRESEPAAGRHDHAARPVQEAPLAGGRARRSTSCICCSTSTTRSRTSSSTRSPNASSCSAA